MKKFFVLTTFFLFAITCFKMQAQIIECYDNNTPPDATCGDWSTTLTETVNIDYPYDMCPIEVRYETKTCEMDANSSCPGQRIVQVRIIGMDWDFYSTDCDDLTVHIFPGFPNDFGDLNEDNLADILTQVQRSLSNILFENYYNSLTAAEKIAYQCDNPGCTMPTSFCTGYTVLYVTPRCMSTCLLYRDNETGPGKDNIYLIPCYNPEPDDEEIEPCCEFKRIFCVCVDNQGNYIGTKVTETSTSEPGTCNGTQAAPGWNCPPAPPGKTRYTYPCSFRCPYL